MIIVSILEQKSRASKFMKQELKELLGFTDYSTIKIEYFNTLVLSIHGKKEWKHKKL